MKDLTLHHLFFSGAEDGDGEEGILDDRDDSMAGLKDDIEEQLSEVPFKTIQKELMAKLGEVLDVGLEEVLGPAWTKSKAIQEYADPEKHPSP